MVITNKNEVLKKKYNSSFESSIIKAKKECDYGLQNNSINIATTEEELYNQLYEV